MSDTNPGSNRLRDVNDEVNTTEQTPTAKFKQVIDKFEKMRNSIN